MFRLHSDGASRHWSAMIDPSRRLITASAPSIISSMILATLISRLVCPTDSPASRLISSKSPVNSGVGGIRKTASWETPVHRNVRDQ